MEIGPDKRQNDDKQPKWLQKRNQDIRPEVRRSGGDFKKRGAIIFSFLSTLYL